MGDLLIRGLQPTDRADIEEMLRTCGAFNEQEVVVALEIFDIGTAGGYALFGVVHGAAIGGYICLAHATLTESTWYVYWICVHPSLQRAGLGQALQQHAETYVRSQGGRRLVLETSGRPDYDRTRRFYIRAGFREVGRIPDFYRPGDDCVIYSKEL